MLHLGKKQMPMYRNVPREAHIENVFTIHHII